MSPGVSLGCPGNRSVSSPSRGNLDRAIDMFNKAINLAKSEMEMAHLYSLCDAAYAQTEVARKYGLKPPTL